MMKIDENNQPIIERGGRDCLAVRVAVEGELTPGKVVDVIVNADGKFINLKQGLSLTIPPKTNIPPHLFNPRRGLACCCIPKDALNDNAHLSFVEDSLTHAMIAPKYVMRVQEFEKHLEATRPLWEVKNDD